MAKRSPRVALRQHGEARLRWAGVAGFGLQVAPGAEYRGFDRRGFRIGSGGGKRRPATTTPAPSSSCPCRETPAVIPYPTPAPEGLACLLAYCQPLLPLCNDHAVPAMTGSLTLSHARCYRSRHLPLRRSARMSAFRLSLLPASALLLSACVSTPGPEVKAAAAATPASWAGRSASRPRAQHPPPVRESGAGLVNPIGPSTITTKDIRQDRLRVRGQGQRHHVHALRVSAATGFCRAEPSAALWSGHARTPVEHDSTLHFRVRYSRHSPAAPGPGGTSPPRREQPRRYTQGPVRCADPASSAAPWPKNSARNTGREPGRHGW